MPGLWQQQLTCQKGQLFSGYYLHDYHQDYHFVIIIIITIFFIIMITLTVIIILTNIREKPFLFAPKQSSCLVCVECCAVLKRWKYKLCHLSCLSVCQSIRLSVFSDHSLCLTLVMNRWNLEQAKFATNPQTLPFAQYENKHVLRLHWGLDKDKCSWGWKLFINSSQPFTF